METSTLTTDTRGYWFVQYRETPQAKRKTKTFGHSSKVSREQAQVMLERFRQEGDASPSHVLSVSDVFASYLLTCRRVYSPGETANVYYALHPFNERFGDLLIDAVRPMHLRQYRDTLAETLARSTANARLIRLKRAFRWAVECELMRAEIYGALALVKGVKHGHAREAEPVPPVERDVVDATLPHLCATVADMVRLQLLTGMRPAEVCTLKASEIDMTRAPWVANFSKHKMSHLGLARRVYFGPDARRIIEPRLHMESLNATIFRRKDGLPHNTRSYRDQIWRACDTAFPPPDGLNEQAARAWVLDHRWSPNRLRHTAITTAEREFGLDAARAIAGHKNVTTTQIYVQRDEALACQAIERCG